MSMNSNKQSQLRIPKNSQLRNIQVHTWSTRQHAREMLPQREQFMQLRCTHLLCACIFQAHASSRCAHLPAARIFELHASFECTHLSGACISHARASSSSEPKSHFNWCKRNHYCQDS